MKKILVFAYPFNQIERIVDYAVCLAQDLELPLEFIHVIETPTPPIVPVTGATIPGGILPDTVPNDFVDNHSRILQKTLSIKNASTRLPVAYSYSVTAGSVQAAISNISLRSDVELVLVPNPGKSGDGQIINEILDGINHPIFAFPIENRYQRIRRICYATDYHENDRATLHLLAGLARKVMASVTVFHVGKDQKFENSLKSQSLKELLEKQPEFRGIEVTETRSTKITSGIKNFSKKNYADLVVLLKQNKGFLKELFTGSTSKNFVEIATVPVLIYHEQ